MAEEALKKVEEKLDCPICVDTYTDPKLLQCFHTYCRKCLVPLVVRDQQGQLGLTCPACRQVTPIPDRGVAGLQPAFHINHLLEIRESLQKPENQAATDRELAPAGVNPSEKTSNCSVHKGKELELYCETCGQLICSKCALKGGEHHDHDYEEVGGAFEKYRKEVTSSLKPMEKQIEATKKALKELDTCSKEISNQQAAIETNIHITFGGLREVLNLRETKLLSQLDEITRAKLEGLKAQRNQIETTLAQLTSCLHFMTESLKTGTKRDVLMMKTNTIKQIKELDTPIQPEPNTEADTVFSTLSDLTAMCQNFGQVFALGSPDPSRCYATGNGTKEAVVGGESTAIIQAINFHGKPCGEPIKSLESKLVSQITGTIVNCGVSHYEISYQPTIKGRHQLHIRVEGQDIRGSPYSVSVKSAVEKLGAPILVVGGVRPRDIAINQWGEMVVVEAGKDCISVFSPSGEKLRSFGTHGSSPGQLSYPRGVAVDGDGNILVVDSYNHRIQKFTAEGQFIAAAGAYGNGKLQFVFPCGTTYNMTNTKLYVMDRGNYRVQVLNSDLTFSSTFGRSTGVFSMKGHFDYPSGHIACDNTGKVYVVDSSKCCVHIFTAEGVLLRMFGRGLEELQSPRFIAIDDLGMIYVGNWNGRISVFTSDGQFVVSFGNEGEQPGEFNRPNGLAVDSCGVLYVCDTDNERIQLF